MNTKDINVSLPVLYAKVPGILYPLSHNGLKQTDKVNIRCNAQILPFLVQTSYKTYDSTMKSYGYQHEILLNCVFP